MMKILVVDKNALIRDALRVALKELKDDADVLEASDGRQAMALIAENADELGLILLDLGLPDRDGFSALARDTRVPSDHLRRRAVGPARPPVRGQGARSRRARLHSEIGPARSDAQRAAADILRRDLYPAGDPHARQPDDGARDEAAGGRTPQYLASRHRPDRTAARCAGTDDARQEQQSDLPRARPAGADCQEP